MTYKPNESWRVVFNRSKPSGRCATRDCLVKSGPGFVYVTPDGRWQHTRCHHAAGDALGDR